MSDPNLVLPVSKWRDHYEDNDRAWDEKTSNREKPEAYKSHAHRVHDARSADSTPHYTGAVDVTWWHP